MASEPEKLEYGWYWVRFPKDTKLPAGSWYPRHSADIDGDDFLEIGPRLTPPQEESKE